MRAREGCGRGRGRRSGGGGGCRVETLWEQDMGGVEEGELGTARWTRV